MCVYFAVSKQMDEGLDPGFGSLSESRSGTFQVH